VFVAAELVPAWLSIVLWGLLLATCALAARFADWRALWGVSARHHLLFGSIAFCLALWLLKVHTIDGLWIHLLGVTTVTLIIGWRFCVIAGAVATAIYTLLLGESFAATPVAWLLSVAVPATVARLLVHVLRRYRGRNLFVYMLGAGFGGGLLAPLAVAAVALPLLWLMGQQAWVEQALESWPLVTLLMFPEGFINGMVITTLTVFYPQLVKTFDDEYYLGKAD
jgi:uncharacterized membrane protein